VTGAPEKAPATALGWSMTANLGGDRQVVFQSFVPSDAPDPEINAVIDRAVRIVDRQQARHEIVAYTKERADLQADVEQGDANIETVEANYKKAQAEFDVQALELNRAIGTTRAAAAEKAAQRGQSPHAALKGQGQSLIDRCDQGLAQIKEDRARQAEERTVALEGFHATQKRRRDRIALLDTMISEKRALIDGG
jgi:phage protein D